MIKTTELRIGNLFFDAEKNPCFVFSISKYDDICCILLEHPDIPLGRVGFRDAYPVATNEEWLRRFGFNRSGNWVEKDGFCIDLIDKRCVYEWSDETYSYIPFPEEIHTLQNLFFAVKKYDLYIENGKNIKHLDGLKI